MAVSVFLGGGSVCVSVFLGVFLGRGICREVFWGSWVGETDGGDRAYGVGVEVGVTARGFGGCKASRLPESCQTVMVFSGLVGHGE